MNKYEKIIKYIKRKIVTCDIKAGEKLPSIRSISEEFKCSKATVVKAYEIMENEKIIYSIPKSGYYLIENSFKKGLMENDEKVDFESAAQDKSVLPYKEFHHCADIAIDLYKNSLFSADYAQGHPNLIEVVRKQLENYQVFANKENIFITSGSQQAINILNIMDFRNNKENVLVEEPTYYGVLKSLELNHIKTIGIKRGANGIDFDEFEEILKLKSIKFFYTIPRFHNPTGFSYDTEDKKIILKLCKKYDVYIVEDDYLGDLELDNKSDPIYALDMESRVIYLKTYSKVLFPGIRVSAAVIPNKLAKIFKEYKKWNDLNTSILAQGTLEIYIKSGMFDENIKRLRKIYSERMNYLKELTQNLNSPNIKWYIPKSGFFASFEIKKRVDVNRIIEKLKAKNIIIMDAAKFYLNNNNDKFIRISVSRTNLHKIKKGIYEITKAVEEG
ncbi:PLP-dependent aminotransferase family protein [Clostridium neuense]|uniref:PLP-dependent aminotransferase family protein n=1 Tax=Clostridium neuense TaxID=1728934 RepID=A0ABW8TLP1_9CLOT